MKAIGPNATVVQGDVAKMADLDLLYETVGKVKGRVDIIFAMCPQIAGSSTDLKDRHIRSNVISPGPIRTPLVQVCTKERIAALLAPQTPRDEVPFILAIGQWETDPLPAIEPARMIEPPSFKSGKGLLYREERTHYIDVDQLVKMFFGDFTESNEFADAGVNCADCVHRADGTHGRTR